MKGPEDVLASWPLEPVLGCHSVGSNQLGCYQSYQIVIIPCPGVDFGYLRNAAPLFRGFASRVIKFKENLKSFLAQLPQQQASQS